MSQPFQCQYCLHNVDNAGICYRNNDGKPLALLETPCSSRCLMQICPTCNLKIGVDCDRKKHFWKGYCRPWVINPKYDLRSFTWSDGQNHYCPCNGRCHTEQNPCSLDCVSHHHLIQIKGKTETASKGGN